MKSKVIVSSLSYSIVASVIIDDDVSDEHLTSMLTISELKWQNIVYIILLGEFDAAQL